MLQPGEQVPHFEVTAVDGQRFSYEMAWQRRHLVLVILPPESDGFEAGVMRRASEFAALDTACVLTREHVEGVPVPGVLIADRWGEIAHISAATQISNLPSADDLLAWAEHLQQRCPECEGEAR